MLTQNQWSKISGILYSHLLNAMNTGKKATKTGLRRTAKAKYFAG